LLAQSLALSAVAARLRLDQLGEHGDRRFATDSTGVLDALGVASRSMRSRTRSGR
jgi:hypothetical protein